MTLTTTETTQGDTVPASLDRQTISPTMVGMTLLANPETPCEEEPVATVQYLPLYQPTPEELAANAAKKAKRRLGGVSYDTTQSGGHKARYFNEAGFDAYGYDRRGNYDPSQRTTDLPTPFPHHRADQLDQKED